MRTPFAEPPSHSLSPSFDDTLLSEADEADQQHLISQQHDTEENIVWVNANGAFKPERVLITMDGAEDLSDTKAALFVVRTWVDMGWRSLV
jgi:hypothetical protein